MSDFEVVVEFPDFAIEALRRGEWIVLKLKDDLYCKVMPYPIEEEIKDEFNEKEVVFKFEPKRIKNEEKLDSEGDHRTGEASSTEH